jgi:hypothetical protein
VMAPSCRRASASFPRSPIMLRFRFTSEGDPISRLQIGP